MKQEHQVRQSIAVSVMLAAILFLTPLVTIKPLGTELFSKETPVDETEGDPFAGGQLDSERRLKVLDGTSVTEMDLGTYLLGVVRAEMPASFELEALKAQTVAARTYTLHKLINGGNHGEAADLCTDPSCCQAYCSEEQARENWGAAADTNEAKLREAVETTDGQAILYGGVPILAVFHSSSAGLTRSAGEGWVKDLPHLRAGPAPEAGERIPNYYSRAEFSTEEFREKIRTAYPEAEFSGEVSSWLRDVQTDDAGSVMCLCVGGITMKGTELRSLLGLRSACFDWEIREDTIVFFVTGYGHGVGLSQYGANQMALEGADYRGILTHYYTGVTVEPYRGG